MLQRLTGAILSRGALLLSALVIPAACSLTEEVRTRPGGPGDNPFPASTGGVRASGGRSGHDGGNDAGAGGSEAGADGATDGGGSGGRSGSGGGTSGSGGAGGALVNDASDPRECAEDITFACHDYCGALSLVSECRYQLNRSAGVKPDGGTYFPDGSVPHELAPAELLVRCKCDCERRFRTPACRYDFDQFIMCAVPPLTVVCATDPDLLDQMPSVIGPCGALRSAFVQCLETPPPPPPDGGS